MTRSQMIAAALVFCWSAAFAQRTGGRDLGLAGSSVMWSPNPSALFLNPAELSRIRQSEFGFNAFRLSSLSSFAGTSFFPSVGTFAAGVVSYGPQSEYLVGYGYPIGGYSGFGLAVSGFRGGEQSFGLSLGGALHVPTEGEMSGLHAGLSINDFSDKTDYPSFSASFGAAYWIFNNLVRAQGAFQHTSVKNDVLLGAEYLPVSWLAVQMGTRSFKEITAGLRLVFAYGAIELAGGKTGGVFSIVASIGEPASAQRDRAMDEGDQALQDGEYFEAADHYRRAMLYDPYSSEAVHGIDSALAVVRTETSGAMEAAHASMDKKDFIGATRSFQRVLQVDPDNDEARSKLKEMHSVIETYVHQLVIVGDSLRSRRESERARKTYEQVLELNPENDSVKTRIADLKSLARENVRTILANARTLLDRGQTDDAEKEYERVLAMEPRNTAARRGLEAVRDKRNDELFSTGKSAFDNANYLEALGIFLSVLKNNEKNKAAADYVAQARAMLLPEAENFFRAGLQYYTKDNFKSALAEWDKVLLIDPNHRATLEYRKRADEKIKALERLK